LIPFKGAGRTPPEILLYAGPTWPDSCIRQTPATGAQAPDMEECRPSQGMPLVNSTVPHDVPCCFLSG
jgi:hypothetical protein